jgi:hypothetical protein
MLRKNETSMKVKKKLSQLVPEGEMMASFHKIRDQGSPDGIKFTPLKGGDLLEEDIPIFG